MMSNINDGYESQVKFQEFIGRSGYHRNLVSTKDQVVMETRFHGDQLSWESLDPTAAVMATACLFIVSSKHFCKSDDIPRW